MNLIFLMIDNYAITGVQANFERGYMDSKQRFYPVRNQHINIKE